MTPDRFRACLALLHWSQRGLAALLQCDERQVRRWAAGAAIPERIADWLERLATFHASNPPPPDTVDAFGMPRFAAGSQSQPANPYQQQANRSKKERFRL